MTSAQVVSQCHLKQSFSGLHSPGRSYLTYVVKLLLLKLDDKTVKNFVFKCFAIHAIETDLSQACHALQAVAADYSSTGIS